MEERRKSTRFSTELKSRYFIKETKKGWEECTLVDVSREGVRISLHTSEKISAGLNVTLEVIVPGELDPLILKGNLKWVQERENVFIAGIELARTLDEVTFAKLS